MSNTLPAPHHLQSTSAPNKTRDGIGREEIPQSSVTATSGALIGRKKRGISSASAKEERLFPEFAFEGDSPNEARHVIGRGRNPQSSVTSISALCTTTARRIFATARAVASRAASMATSMAASVLLQFPINLSVHLHCQENRRLGLFAALLVP